MSLIHDLNSTILSNSRIAPETYLLRVSAPPIAEGSLPGQFAMLKVCAETSCDPLLRRPLSIHRLDRDSGSAEFLYRVVGRGTRMLGEMKRGDTIRILGPLGRGFTLKKGCIPVLVGGGLGMAPLLFLAESLMGRRGIIILGAVTKRHLLRLNAFAATDLELLVCTEDGSLGNRGVVTESLDRLLSELDMEARRQICVAACGPLSMLKAVVNLCKDYHVECQVSMETVMACGCGLCLGCALKAVDGFVHVCKEGPVFHAARLDWSSLSGDYP